MLMKHGNGQKYRKENNYEKENFISSNGVTNLGSIFS